MQETTTSKQFKEVQKKTNSGNSHLVFLIYKKKQENDGVGDISSLFQRRCQTNDNDNGNVFGNKDEISPTPSFSYIFLEYQEYKMSIFGICFILYNIQVLCFIPDKVQITSILNDF